MIKKIVSFGFKHGKPPDEPGVSFIDIRSMFRNPYTDLSLRAKTGLHIEVGEYIKKTRGFKTQYEFVKKQASVPGTKVLYVGCTGGRHRSVFIAEILGNELGIAIEHRDLEKSHA